GRGPQSIVEHHVVRADPRIAQHQAAQQDQEAGQVLLVHVGGEGDAPLPHGRRAAGLLGRRVAHRSEILVSVIFVAWARTHSFSYRWASVPSTSNPTRSITGLTSRRSDRRSMAKPEGGAAGAAAAPA